MTEAASKRRETDRRKAPQVRTANIVDTLSKSRRLFREISRAFKLPGCALRSLALAVIGPNYAPQSIFKHEDGRDLAKHHRQFAFHCLDHVGRLNDKALIEVWRDASELGRASVPTLRDRNASANVRISGYKTEIPTQFYGVFDRFHRSQPRSRCIISGHDTASRFEV